MIRKVSLVPELVVKIPNKIGMLAEIASLIAEKGINIEAISGYARENTNDAYVMLISNKCALMEELLKTKKYAVSEKKDVLMVEVENEPGVLQHIAVKLAEEEINIQYIYGTTYVSDSPAKIVISTGDNEKALKVLRR